MRSKRRCRESCWKICGDKKSNFRRSPARRTSAITSISTSKLVYQHGCLVIELDQLYRTNPIISSLDPFSAFYLDPFCWTKTLVKLLFCGQRLRVIKSYKQTLIPLWKSIWQTGGKRATRRRTLFSCYISRKLENARSDWPQRINLPAAEVMSRQGFSESPPETFCLTRILLALLSRAGKFNERTLK